jgi:hypothetical protein
MTAAELRAVFDRQTTFSGEWAVLLEIRAVLVSRTLALLEATPMTEHPGEGRSLGRGGAQSDAQTH